MANISFKRGVHSELPVSNIVDGAFYLTTDTHRLYTGIKKENSSEVELVDLNQYIQIVEDEYALNNLKNVELGDFVYIKTGNILAVYREIEQSGGIIEKRWTQVNSGGSGTTYNDFTTSQNNDDNHTMVLSLIDSGGDVLNNFIKLSGTNGIDFKIIPHTNEEGQNPELQVVGPAYNLSGEIKTTGDTANQVTDIVISLDNGIKDEVDPNKQKSSITLNAGDNISFEKINEKLAISSRGVASVNIKAHENNQEPNGNLTIELIDKNADKIAEKTAGSFLYYTYGKSGDQYGFNQGQLDVYTTAEVDSLLNNLNGLTYKSVISSFEELPTAPNGNIHIGDMYMASTTFEFGLFGHNAATKPAENEESNYTKVSSNEGDLFIAQGTENDNGVIISDLMWHYVPAGSSTVTDTVYQASINRTNNELTLKDQNGNILTLITAKNKDGWLKLDSKDSTDSTDSTVSNWILNIDHATKEKFDNKPVEAVNNDGYVEAIDSIDYDRAGHITGIHKKRTNLYGYKLLEESQVTVDESLQKATIPIQLYNSINDLTSHQDVIINTSADDCLKIAPYKTEGAGVDSPAIGVSLSLEWGSF